ncbi:MAG: alpha/beta fold hydrolase [Phycisphaerales bacterium]
MLLPGLAADARQFAPQRYEFPALRVGEWIAHRPSESLVEYAARLAPSLKLMPDSVLGGSSFGGMIALEVARLMRPRAVVLIGSCRSPRELHPALALFARIGRHLPGAVIDMGRCLAVPMAAVAGPAPLHIRRELAAMSRGIPASYLKWAAGAVMEWPGCPDPGVPVYQIHGGADRMMPIDRVQADIVVLDAGHVFNMTHPEPVNEFIDEVLMGRR